MIRLADVLLLYVARWVLILAEVLIAKRIYSSVKRRALLRHKLAELGSIATALLRPHTTSRPQDQLAPSRGLQLEAASVLLLGEMFPSPPRILWRKLAEAVQVVAVFAAVFLGASYLMNPLTGQWALFLLPPVLPFLLLPLPYLLGSEPPASLLLIGAGLAMGILPILLLGV